MSKDNNKRYPRSTYGDFNVGDIIGRIDRERKSSEAVNHQIDQERQQVKTWQSRSDASTETSDAIIRQIRAINREMDRSIAMRIPFILTITLENGTIVRVIFPHPNKSISKIMIGEKKLLIIANSNQEVATFETNIKSINLHKEITQARLREVQTEIATRRTSYRDKKTGFKLVITQLNGEKLEIEVPNPFNKTIDRLNKDEISYVEGGKRTQISLKANISEIHFEDIDAKK